MFVPLLQTRAGLTDESRSALLEGIRSLLASGAHDRHGRRPRVRWELRPEQKPLSRLLGQTHRLTEHLAKLHQSLTKWKVQPSGKGVEFWLMRENLRPLLMGKIRETGLLSNVASIDGVLTEAQIQEAWRGISS